MFEQVGPLTRLTIHVVWTMTASDPRLSGQQEIAGVWMIDPRDDTFVGHGEWMSALTLTLSPGLTRVELSRRIGAHSPGPQEPVAANRLARHEPDDCSGQPPGSVLPINPGAVRCLA